MSSLYSFKFLRFDEESVGKWTGLVSKARRLLYDAIMYHDDVLKTRRLPFFRSMSE